MSETKEQEIKRLVEENINFKQLLHLRLANKFLIFSQNAVDLYDINFSNKNTIVRFY